jgi:cobyrinic acid a,c-diamide synthase
MEGGTKHQNTSFGSQYVFIRNISECVTMLYISESCHASVNGYSTYRNGSTTNGVVTNGVSKHLHDSVQAPHPNAQGDHEKPVKK